MFKETFSKIKAWYRGLPDKKRYVEFITALLTVPVLLTVLITNLSSINNSKKNQQIPTPAVAPTEKIIVVTNQVTPATSISPTLTPTTATCKKEVGPTKITKPVEGELVTTDAVCVEISYDDSTYCPVNWRSRVDGGDWSDLNNKNFCLYNMSPGPHELELNVKSTASTDELTLIRNFYYKSKTAPTPTSTLTVTP